MKRLSDTQQGMKKAVVMMAVALLAAACSKSEEETQPAAVVAPSSTPELALTRIFSPEAITRGAGVFQAHCAECHGPQAQGHPGWGYDDGEKLILSPPLDGNGNTWKRSRQEMAEMIKNGVRRGDTLVMPAWKGRLSDEDIEDAITWFQALWPPEVYEQWQKAQAETGPAKRGS